MRVFVVLFLGIAVGACIAVAFLFYNPFTAQASLSPLSVSEQQQISLSYSAVAENSILFTNDGESRVAPYPAKVLQLWEAPVRQTTMLVAPMHDARNELAGFGIKFSSWSERTNLLDGKALMDSAWYIYMPEQGSLFIEQSENHWSFLREIVASAYMSSGDNWRGRWLGTITDGPGALGTARVRGGSGKFRDLESESIEVLAAKAFSTELGPVGLDGLLTIDLPSATTEVE